MFQSTMKKKENNRLKDILGIFVVWRASLLIFTFFALWLLGDLIKNSAPIDFWQSWAAWDGGHFLGIAKNGYVVSDQFAFFPLYPLLIKIFSFLFLGNFLASALVLSSLFLLLALYFFFKLAKLDFDLKTSQRAIFYLLISPTAFFLAAAYCESLFIFLAVGALYFARRRRWPMAAIFATLAAATKPLGILLWPVLVFEYLAQLKFRLRQIRKDFIWLTVPPLGLLSYMLYLQIVTGNPLTFLTVQASWQREVFIFPLSILWQKYLSIFSLSAFGSLFFAVEVLEFSAAIAFLLLLIFSIGKLRVSYLLYCALLVLVSLSTGVLTSFPRFFLLAFPLFFSLAILAKNQLFDRFLTIIFLLHQALFLALFLNGIWIA